HYLDLIALRANLDLAVLTIAGVQRTGEMVQFIRARATDIFFESLDELRILLRNSTLFRTPDGRAFFGDEEVPQYHFSVHENVDGRLETFKHRAERLIEDVAKAQPPWQLVDQCRHRMEGLKMSQPASNVTNISFQGSTIGVLNTGAIDTINGISQAINSLKGKGEGTVADSLAAITKQVAESKEIPSEGERKEILEQL